MFDGFQILLVVASIFDRLMEQILGLVDHVLRDTGEIFSHTATVDGVRIRLLYRKKKLIKLNGSIHRYYTKGDNDSLFTYRNLVLAVHALAAQFGFGLLQAHLQRVEFGVNIPVEDPEEMINSAVLYNGHPATKRKQKRWNYYKEWQFSEYAVKLYKKGEHLVRFEVRIYKERYRKKIQLYTLADLINYDKFVLCLKHLESCARHFLFVPNGDTLPVELHTEWARYRNDQYWRRLAKRQRSTKSRRKDKVEATIKQYALMDWAAFIVEGIRAQGSLMISPEDATFSRLGLLRETVAGPTESCNRLEENILAPLPQRRRVCRRETGVSSYLPQFILHPARPPPRAPSAN